MGSLRLTLCTGLLAACALTPTAHAADGADGGGAGLSVTPSAPAPGADLALRVTGCAERTATAHSTAFVADARLAGTEGTLAGDTRVRASAEPGPYDVNIMCGSFLVKSRITVVSQSQSQSQSQSEPESQGQAQSQPEAESLSDASSAVPAAPLAPVSPAAPASPVAPVHAGGGGTAHFATVDVSAAGPGTGQAVTGLVLVGVAAAAVALLSARRSRGTD
ncbi:hypothetical protein OG895_13570 [Streptomyces sp. NBC_00201]|uniref:hypothetical protein n=1 Tax=Streptomyces sp. NBC_00201 TaxID=2975679 RepID=UPI002253D29B|nr:hypothetical protein [Streptomyces sp. NBC_00201]MCX5246254.1 hypothetical protein [Streptomyces sp. NBC_00201]